jgi:hypothetical protein
MITMTYNEGLAVQDKQFEHYKSNLSQSAAFRLGNKLVAETLPCPTDSQDEPISARDMVHIMPRGTWFEEPANMAIWAYKRTQKAFKVTP